LIPGGDPLDTFNTELGKINSTVTPTGNKIPQATGFSLGVIGDLIFHKGQSYASLGSLVDALRTDGDIALVLNQKVITQDGKQSTLFSGSNIPFNGSVVQTNQSGATTQFTSNIEYRDVGINLTLTPRVGDDGMITMLVDEEITQQTNTGQNDNSSGNTTPTVFGIETSKNSTQTQVTMPDDHFLVLSGSIRTQTSTQRTSIPCLGGLPLIGAAFTNNETLTAKRNVIIFMKPKIINTFNNYNEITDKQEDILTNDSPVAESVEQAFDLVKTPDDERIDD
ncbi:MAG: hypothetical protein P0S94_04305, partial [Simkaniaceae bacterium]|nr:hypothetical protein [Simkaniaceae bacterium]